MKMNEYDPVAEDVVRLIQSGDVTGVKEWCMNQDVANVTIVATDGTERSLLHIVTDWPGHIEQADQLIAVLCEAGADVNAAFVGVHRETPLHWAASCNDLRAMAALCDEGADIEAPGGVLTSGPPLDDAVIFKQWEAAHFLVEKGAETCAWHEAALGLTDRLATHQLTQKEKNAAFWFACFGGQLKAAQNLAHDGADMTEPVHEGLSPLAVAEREGHTDVVSWLLDVLSENF